MNTDVKMMHQGALKHNQDFTAVIKHVAVNLERMGILISQNLQRKISSQQSWKKHDYVWYSFLQQVI